MISVGFDARHLVWPEVRGLTRYTVELLRALSRLGSSRLVLFSNAPLHAPHLEGIQAETVIFRSGRRFAWEHFALPRKILESDIDVFHAPADRGLPFLKVCPYTVTLHDSYERSYWRTIFPGLKKKLHYLFSEGINYFLADAVISVSKGTRNELEGLKIAPPKKLVHIYHGVGKQFDLVDRGQNTDVLTSYGVSAHFILYVGGYDARKNVDYLIRSFENARLLDYQLVIVARKPSDFNKRIETWQRLSCFDRIHFLEVQDKDLPSLYRSAQFFVNPSLWESFSLQLLEAMACGTPIICSNRKAMPEILGDAGLYFDPGDPFMLSDLMRMLSLDTGLRAKLRNRGVKRASDFSWKKTAQETLSLYFRLIRERG